MSFEYTANKLTTISNARQVSYVTTQKSVILIPIGNCLFPTIVLNSNYNESMNTKIGQKFMP